MTDQEKIMVAAAIAECAPCPMTLPIKWPAKAEQYLKDGLEVLQKPEWTNHVYSSFLINNFKTVLNLK